MRVRRREVRLSPDRLLEKVFCFCFLMLKHPDHAQQIESTILSRVRAEDGLQLLVCLIEIPRGNLFRGLLQL